MSTALPARVLVRTRVGTTTAYNLDRSTGRLFLTLVDTRTNSPGTLRVEVGAGDPLSRVYFFFDAQVGPSPLYVDLDENGGAAQIYLPVRGLMSGLHTVRVSPVDSPPDPADEQANKTFTVDVSKDTVVYVPPPTQTPPPANVPNRWIFQAYDFSDINAVDTYVLTPNPTSAARAFGSTAVTDEATTVSNGKIVSWEGMATPPTWTLQGSVFTEAAFREMVKWGKTGQRFYVTDDFGHRYLVKCVGFDVTRVRDVQRPWNHTYRMRLDVLQGTGVFTP